MDRRLLLVLMTMASAVNYLGRLAMSIAGPEIARQYRFTEAELGQIFSAFWLGYAVMMWPAGWLADRFGPARTLGICGLLSAFFLSATAWSTALFAFLILRFAFGLASAALYPACGGLSARWFPSDFIATVQGIVIGGSNVGGIVAPWFITFLMAQRGWPWSFQVTGGLTLGLFIVWFVLLKDRAGEGRAGTVAVNPRLLRLPLMLLALQSFAIGYFYNFVDTWSYYYFKEVRQFTQEQSVLFTTLLQIFGAIMMPLGGWLSDVLAPSFGRKNPALLSLATAGALTGASALATEPALVLMFLAAAYSLVVAAEGAYWWAVLFHAPDQPGAAYGFANTVGSVAQFLAPLALPWIAARWTWTGSVWSVAAALFLSVILWNSAFRSTPAQPAT
jgi:MFS family permease